MDDLCTNSLLKSVHFEHFWVNPDQTPKLEFGKEDFFVLKSLLKSVHFEHFWVNPDQTPT